MGRFKGSRWKCVGITSRRLAKIAEKVQQALRERCVYRLIDVAVILPSNVANEIELAESGARTPVTPMEAALMVGKAPGQSQSHAKSRIVSRGKALGGSQQRGRQTWCRCASRTARARSMKHELTVFQRSQPDGIAGPPAQMIAFHVSHSSRSASAGASGSI